MPRLNDGSAVRRRQPRQTPAVDRCVRMYQRLIRWMEERSQSTRAIMALQARLAARIGLLSPREQDAYYRSIYHLRTAAVEEPPVSWS